MIALALMLKLDARALGILLAVFSVAAAAAESAEPSLTTVTVASTVLADTAAPMLEAETPSALATLLTLMVGGASVALDEVASTACVAMKLALV